MSVQDLFGAVPLGRFVAEHLHRLPFAISGTARGVCELGSWATLGAILSVPDVDTLIVREGRQVECPQPRDVAGARSLSAEGCTILVRHAERHDRRIGDLARQFEASFHAPVNVHIYATPAGSFGFSWHYDAEDVFILQTEGEKEYFLRKNTVHPWPLEETIPADMRYERELMPLMRVVLGAGDLLYIPCGYWHRAESRGSGPAAISLAVGIMSRAGIDLYDRLRPRLLESLLWRQRLPVDGRQSAEARQELRSNYERLVEQLAADFAAAITDPSFIEAILPKPPG